MLRRFTYCLVILILLSICGCTTARAQYFRLADNRKKVTTPFKMIRNMVIIKLKINNKGPYNFILDTGVGVMIITDPTLIDSLSIPHKKITKISGLGGNEAYEAYATCPLNIEIPGMHSVDVGAYVFNTDHFGLSNYAGIPIHGLLGYDFFSKLVVKINFTDSSLTSYRPEVWKKPRGFESLPMSIEDRKPYITTPVSFCDESVRQCKLVVDLGAGHPLSLENSHTNQWPTRQAITANLGMGLTGPVKGKISRVTRLSLGKYTLNNVLSSFPDNRVDNSLTQSRDGNLGVDILKRFTVIFDYNNGKLYLKPRTSLHEPFEHDMSGMEYYAGGDDYDHIVVGRVEPGSASDEIGLEKDDEIVSVNLKPVLYMGLEELDRLFRSGNGRGLLLTVYHEKRYTHIILTLKRRI